MKDQPDLKAINKWVTDARMKKVVRVAEIVLNTPTTPPIDSSLQAGDGEIIGEMLLSQIKDETGMKIIFTEATKSALREAATTWFLCYLKEKPQ